jgi:hypothetical protein
MAPLVGQRISIVEEVRGHAILAIRSSIKIGSIPSLFRPLKDGYRTNSEQWDMLSETSKSCNFTP